MSKESALAYFMSATEGQAPATEATPEAVTEQLQAQEGEVTPEAPTELKSTPFSKLAKQEREFMEKREAFKKELEEFEKNKQKVLDANTKLEEFHVRKKSDPISALKDLGFNEADLVNFLAGEQKPELSAEDKITAAASDAADKKIKAWEEERTKKDQEAQKKKDEDLINDYKGEITQKLEAEKESYPFCSFWGQDAQDLVYELTVKTLEESKGAKMLSVQDALKMAEDYFEEKSDAMIAIKNRKTGGAKPPETQEEKTTVAEAMTRSQAKTRPGYPNAPQPKPMLQGNRLSRTLGSQATASASSAKPANETYEQKRARIIDGLKNGKF